MVGSTQSTKTRLGADCASDHEIFTVKFKLKLKKGKITWLFRYYLNQIPHDYVVAVMNRFKGLELIDKVPEQLCTEVHNTIQKAVTKAIPKKKRHKKAKWLFEEALQIDEKRREAKGKGERESRVPGNSKER